MNREQYRSFLIKNDYIEKDYRFSETNFLCYYEAYYQFNGSTTRVYDKEEGDSLALNVAKNIELYWQPTSLVKCQFKHVIQVIDISFDLFPGSLIEFSIGVNEKYHPLHIGSKVAKILYISERVSIRALKKIFYALQYYQISEGCYANLLESFILVKPSEEEQKWMKQLETFSESSLFHNRVLTKLSHYEIKLYEKQMNYLSVIEEIFPLVLKQKNIRIKTVLLITIEKCLIENTQEMRIRQLSFYLSHKNGVFRRLLFSLMKEQFLLHNLMFEFPRDIVYYMESYYIWLYLLHNISM